ncbi:MAG: aminotransferase class I/II-fold pyridoxal phosphate-dependent enzyme [Crocinitomicaceae bacterium]|nr:aminotransferase class I/II-fold pyridoxal phosphate-dependent enzyme [Crocinitomicaceae bacterium]
MSKLPHIGTTIFSVMSQLAADYNAINLSQGFPNFPVDSHLTDLVTQSATENVHQYMPMAGYPQLLSNIGKLIEANYGRKNEPEKELLITAGATQGIFTCIQALVNAGEEVIILDPSYDCYEPPIILTGAVPIRVPLNDDFSPNWEKIESHFNANTRMIIINNPHNPSGKILTQKDFEQLEKILEKFPNVVLLSDEVYEYITFEKKHISVNSIQNLRNKSIIISSFGKTFHITGWKVGYLIAPEKFLIELKKVHQFLVFSVNSVAQFTLSKYLEKVDVKSLGAFYQEKRDLFRTLLAKSRFQLLPSEGSYFQVVDYSGISSEKDTDFCIRLVKEHGVAAIPLSVFNKDEKDQHLIRFCFAKDDETLIKACERLCKI